MICISALQRLRDLTDGKEEIFFAKNLVDPQFYPIEKLVRSDCVGVYDVVLEALPQFKDVQQLVFNNTVLPPNNSYSVVTV